MWIFSLLYSINPPSDGCIRIVGFLQLLRTSRGFGWAHCSRPWHPWRLVFHPFSAEAYSPTSLPLTARTSAQKRTNSPDERRFNTVGECKSYGGISIGTQWSGIGKSKSSSLEWENQASNPLVKITKARHAGVRVQALQVGLLKDVLNVLQDFGQTCRELYIFIRKHVWIMELICEDSCLSSCFPW